MLVGQVGVEPTRLATPGFETGASAVPPLTSKMVGAFL